MKYFIGNWKMFGVPKSVNIVKKINSFRSRDKNRKRYRVIITPPFTLLESFAKQFKNKNSKYLLYPGLIVDCNIVVGKRTLLENIYIPFKRFKDGTFTENVWFY